MDQVRNSESASILFEKATPIRISKAGIEDRLEELTIRIVLGPNKLNRSSKVLRVQITSEGDPFFLHSLDVNEEDFQNLKVEQCILVDFAAFPYKFIELLDYCLQAKGHDNPRFLAVLHVRVADSTFSIVETNHFKHLSHIALCFRPGNDASLKNYLAAKLAELKASNANLYDKLERTLQSLEASQQDLNQMSSELSVLKESNIRCVSELKSEQAIMLTNEREKAMKEMGALKERVETERAEAEKRHQEQSHNLQERATDLDRQVRALLDTKYGLETRLSELQTRLQTVERDLAGTKKECERLRLDNRELDSAKHEKEKTINRHLIRISAFEQQVRDKDEMLGKLTQQVESETAHRVAIEKSLKETQAALGRVEERASTSIGECAKNNQLVEQLQAELRAGRAKLKLKKEVTSQQENLLTERQSALEKSLSENAGLQQSVTALKCDNEGLKSKMEELKEKLEESQEQLKSNQQMIQWLNQQITDAQLGKLGPIGSSTRYSFRPNLVVPSTASAFSPIPASTLQNNFAQSPLGTHQPGMPSSSSPAYQPSSITTAGNAYRSLTQTESGQPPAFASTSTTGLSPSFSFRNFGAASSASPSFPSAGGGSYKPPSPTGVVRYRPANNGNLAGLGTGASGTTEMSSTPAGARGVDKLSNSPGTSGLTAEGNATGSFNFQKDAPRTVLPKPQLSFSGSARTDSGLGGVGGVGSGNARPPGPLDHGKSKVMSPLSAVITKG